MLIRLWKRALVVGVASVQRLLDQLQDPLLARRAVVLLVVRAWPRLALREGDAETAARHLVERVLEECGVLRLLGDMVLAAVNEALKSANSLAESKLGGLAGGLGGLGLPGL